jgi:hypothetical protein
MHPEELCNAEFGGADAESLRERFRQMRVEILTACRTQFDKQKYPIHGSFGSSCGSRMGKICFLSTVNWSTGLHFQLTKPFLALHRVIRTMSSVSMPISGTHSPPCGPIQRQNAFLRGMAHFEYGKATIFVEVGIGKADRSSADLWGFRYVIRADALLG